jgi:hypothetical protein
MMNFTPRRCRQIEIVWNLGPRVVGELLVEISDPIDLDLALTRYARLDGDVVHALGADRFPPLPIHEVAR